MFGSEFCGFPLAPIYLVYGLAFFALGLAVSLEIGRAAPSRFSRALRPLAVFGLLHGSHEWIEMFALIEVEAYQAQPPPGFAVLRLVLLVLSFIFLIAFGVRMLHLPRRFGRPDLWLGGGMLALYGLGVIWLGYWLKWQQPAWFAAADALARYSLAMPGAALAAWALLSQRRSLLQLGQVSFANDLRWAGGAFLLYGLIGQFFINASPLFPSNIVNAETFQCWFGIPIQLFRAAMAGLVAVFTIRALRAFEFQRQQELAAARRQVAEEIAHRDQLRQEFLRRIVETQEEERTRVARELHDELGQVLTGLAVGLRGVQTSVDRPALHQEQLGHLEEMAGQALNDMRHLVDELRPALLDDIGLPAALRHYVDSFSSLTGIETTLRLDKKRGRLPDEVETILFRITQEALTNVARHARAGQVQVELKLDEEQAILQIEDDGVGFDPAAVLGSHKHAAWGLMGIQERVRLVDGAVEIQSEVGQGTTLLIEVPLKNGRNNHVPHQSNAG